MALIKCPECGQENVSDSAEACPNCGFGIKLFFEEEKRKEKEKIIVEKRIQDELLRQQEYSRQQKENIQKLREIKEKRIRKEQEQKDKHKKWIKKNKKFIILGIILILAIGTTICVKNEIYINNTNSELDETVNKYVNSDLYKLIKVKSSIAPLPLKVEYTLTRESRYLHSARYICVYSLSCSSQIQEYEDFKYNSERARILYDEIIKIYDAETLEYSVENIADVIVEIKSEGIFSIKDISGNTLVYKPSEDSVYINDTCIFNNQEYTTPNKTKKIQKDETEDIAPLTITEKDLTEDNGYYYCTGTVHNNSSATLYYVEIRVTYYDSSEDVLTTDTTYAVASEGIKSGENQQFEIMTDVNGNVDKYKVEVTDYSTD